MTTESPCLLNNTPQTTTPSTTNTSIGITTSRLGICLQLFTIATIAGLLRIPYLSTRSIWYDEASSWQTARFSLSGIIESLSRNVHMPLYYFSLKLWMIPFGESVVSLRMFSIGLGIVTTLAMYGVAKECYRLNRSNSNSDEGSDWFVPLATGLFVAVNAFQINASIEVRMYALGTALSALSAWSMIRVIAAPDRDFRWALWTLLCIALTYTHHHCLFMVASQFVFLFGYAAFQYMSSEPAALLLRRGFLAAVAVLVSYLPGAVLLSAQLSRVRQDYWTEPFSLKLVATTFVEFVSPLFRSSDHLWLIAGLSFGLTIISVTFVMIRPRFPGILALTLGGLPLCLAAVVTLTVTPVWEGRFFRFPQLFLLMVLAIAVAQISRRTSFRVTIAGIAILAMSTASVLFWQSRHIEERPGMREVIARIMKIQKKDVIIVSSSNIHLFPAKYYASETAKLRIFRSGTKFFWGDHLYRESDILSDKELEEFLQNGFWVLGHQPIPGGIKELEGILVDHTFEVHYDRGVPDWPIHAAHVRKVNESLGDFD
ncbi:hypothetical protein [Bremerella sp.]|uniref:glycosyltransferase family 39 protein n=1 Tax=Bremerella sp. TaxID=2795602 RepID=UPI003919A364